MPVRHHVFYLLLLLFSFFSCAQKAKNGKPYAEVQVIDLPNFKKKLLDKSIVIIDVRTEDEYSLGHIKEAINIGIKNKREFKNQVSKLNTSQPIYLYCQSGVRSRRAGKVLRKLGFDSIYDFSGGWKTWSKSLH